MRAVPLRLVEPPVQAGMPMPQVGDCWPTPGEGWAVVLPNRRLWLSGFAPWEVTGQAPDLTVTPGISMPGPEPWRGDILNGELVPA